MNRPEESHEDGRGSSLQRFSSLTGMDIDSPSSNGISSGRAGDSTDDQREDSTSGACDAACRRTRKRPRTGSSLSSAPTTPPSADDPMPSMSTTHDTSYVPYHVRQVDDFAKQVNAAVTEAWDYRFRYNAVHALLLMWEDDDLNVASEVSGLEDTLRNDYRYETSIWKIPSEKPGWKIKAKLIEFLQKNDTAGSLIIFYYGGHATANPQQPGGPPLWVSRRQKGAVMSSGDIISAFEEADSDILLLYDCCHAYQPASISGVTSESRKNVMEVISAVGFDDIAAEPGRHSFTHHLIEILSLSARTGFVKAVDIHTELIKRLQAWTPSRQTRGGREPGIVRDQYGPLEEKRRRRCPLHYWLCGASKSITLRPLSRPEVGHTTVPEASSKQSGPTNQE